MQGPVTPQTPGKGVLHRILYRSTALVAPWNDSRGISTARRALLQAIPQIVERYLKCIVLHLSVALFKALG